MGNKLFIPYIMAGDPDLKFTEDLITKIDEKKLADIIELGVPFSDPIADGVTIQKSAQVALLNNITLKKVLNLVYNLRKKVKVPIFLMSYFNIFYKVGIEHFFKSAKISKVDGVIIADLPVEESEIVLEVATKNGILITFLVSSTTAIERIKLIAEKTTGFIYYVQFTGTTGARKFISKDLESNIKTIKEFTEKPVCVGFGVSTPKQIRKILKISDGVIVGSAIIEKIHETNSIKRVIEFIESLHYES